MRSHARVVIVGGGCVGVSVLYVLTNLGWDDSVRLERSTLTSGSIWHAAGLLVTFVRSNPHQRDDARVDRHLFRRLWLAEGVPGGIMWAGVLGERLARWITAGDPGIDMSEVEPRRFGNHVSKRWSVDMVRQTWGTHMEPHVPGEDRRAARPARTAPSHDLLTAKAAVWTEMSGWELPRWYATSPELAIPDFSFHRTRQMDHVSGEVTAVRLATVRRGAARARALEPARASGLETPAGRVRPPFPHSTPLTSDSRARAPRAPAPANECPPMRRGGERARERRARGATPSAVSGREQRQPACRVVPLDRGAGAGTALEAGGAVSRGPRGAGAGLRGGAGADLGVDPARPAPVGAHSGNLAHGPSRFWRCGKHRLGPSGAVWEAGRTISSPGRRRPGRSTCRLRRFLTIAPQGRLREDGAGLAWPETRSEHTSR